MSRHKKVKALDYDAEYDDYYGYGDDEDDDFDEATFENKYLSSGINLVIPKQGNNISVDSSLTHLKQPDLVEKLGQLDVTSDDVAAEQEEDTSTKVVADGFTQSDNVILRDSQVSSDLTKLAVQHLNKQQWQLPLLEMDKRFRDKTYYKHYSDTFITSLMSKLGNFLSDVPLLTNPMGYYIQKEIDNYSKYSKMFEVLTEYYQSIGSGFFSFATPSPDEEIVIGCRLGTKANKQAPKQQPSKPNETKTPRFEYHGRTDNSTSNPSSSKTTTPKIAKESVQRKPVNQYDVTIHEDLDKKQLEDLAKKQLEDLAKRYQSVTIANEKSAMTKKTNVKSLDSDFITIKENKKQMKPKPLPQPSVPDKTPKQLATLTEKRQKLKHQLKNLTDISPENLDLFKKQAKQTSLEYSKIVKNLKPRINLIVVGHVDAGKSTLVGHLLFRLGQISGKQMHRYEVDSQRSGKASFKYAWALDETPEERARGVTIDIAATQFETPNRDVILLDAPGHVDFIPAVITGAAQADAALLVVDATRGEFETGFTSGGQTREHTYLVRALGVKSIIVVINKMDNVNWSWERFSDIMEQLKIFLKQAGFNDVDVQFIGCSGLTGDNMMTRRIDQAIKESSHPQLQGDKNSWKSMPTLIEAIDKINPPERLVEKPTRFSVTDVFKGMSSGVFLGGKVIGGRVQSKQKLLLLPPNETCEVKQVEVRDSRADQAFAGDIGTVIVTGIDLNKYYRGCVLCDPLIPSSVTNRFQARIIMFQNIDTFLMKGTPIELYISGSYESGEVRRLISLMNKNTGEVLQRKPRCLVRNSSAIIQVRLDRLVCCELYENSKDLGRFMIRSFGKTIAAGLITKIKSPKLAKSKRKMRFK